MKNFEELLQFIDAHEEDWKQLLLHAPFNLKAIKQSLYNSNWYCLMYNLYDSIFDNSNEGKIVRECRGTIVEKIKGQPARIVCAPYTKFFNYGEENAADIDWNSAIIREKIDGWLIKCTIGYSSVEQKNHCAIWFSNGAFLDNVEPSEVDSSILVNGLKCENINQVLFAALKNNNEVNFSIIKDVACVTYSKWMDNIPIGTTLMFELTSAWTKICTNYDPYPKLWLHGVRLSNGDEITPEDAKNKWTIPFDIPQQFNYNFAKAEDIQEFMQQWSGKEHEGVVVCDKFFNRIKIKCSDYLKMKYLNDYADSLSKPKNLWKSCINGDIDDILANNPDLKVQFDEMCEKIKKFKELYFVVVKDGKMLFSQCKDKREFAEKIEHNNYVIKRIYFLHSKSTSEDIDNELFNKTLSKWANQKEGYKIFENTMANLLNR